MGNDTDKKEANKQMHGRKKDNEGFSLQHEECDEVSSWHLPSQLNITYFTYRMKPFHFMVGSYLYFVVYYSKLNLTFVK